MGVQRGAALVTGAARRIGRALALQAARAGYDVAVHHLSSTEEAQAVCAEIEALGRKAVALSADLRTPQAVDGLVPAAQAALGPVTLLVNNASLFDDDRVGAISWKGYDAHLETNLRAPVMLAQAFAAGLPADREGLIVNLLDQRVWKPTPQFFTYGLSKSALWAATRTLAQALAPRIRVNGIGPGPTLPSIHQDEAAFAAEFEAVPLQDHATPDDISAALAYLIDARKVTGQMIAVDAGQHLGWRTPDIVAD
jgi:NAD(P)-dependent dehydrogenase (short-subunit alcohol dehydrogenase family)